MNSSTSRCALFAWPNKCTDHVLLLVAGLVVPGIATAVSQATKSSASPLVHGA